MTPEIAASSINDGQVNPFRDGEKSAGDEIFERSLKQTKICLISLWQQLFDVSNRGMKKTSTRVVV